MSAGGGKSSEHTSSQFAPILGAIAGQINNEVDPVRKEFLGQLTQVLQGNLYNNSLLPLIQNATGQMRQAVGQSMQGAESFLAKTGTAQSPFAGSILAQLNQQGNEAIAGIPIQFAQQMLGQVPGAASGFTNSSLGGFSQAAQFSNQHGGSQNQWGVDPFNADPTSMGGQGTNAFGGFLKSIF